MKNKFNNGFTFMELLIALTIFSIIASSLYYTLSGGIRVYRRGNVLIRDNQKLRVFFDTISRDMRNAVPFNVKSAANFQIEPEWLTDKASFPTLINTFGEESMFTELAKVSYYVEKSRREGKKLVRKYARRDEGFDEEFAREESLLEGLEDFLPEELSFEYAYETLSIGFDEDYEWRDEEFEDALPRGVKIILILKNKARNTEEVFTQTVFIPRGEPGSDRE